MLWAKGASLLSVGVILKLQCFPGCSFLNPDHLLLRLLPGGLGGTCLSPSVICQSWALPALACSTEVCCSCGNWASKCAVHIYVEFILGTDAVLKSESCCVGWERWLLSLALLQQRGGTSKHCLRS